MGGLIHELAISIRICYPYCMDTKISQNKRERFKRLASTRTSEVLKRIKILSNCANRSAYDYSEEEISKIFSAIDKAVKDSRSKFYFPNNKINFKL